MHVIAAKNNTINVIAAIIADAYSAGTGEWQALIASFAS